MEGTARGTQCKFPAGENGYCGRHQRNKLYDDGVAEGTIWCRFFSRGCSGTVTTAGTACTTCKDNLRAEKPRCSHEGCTRSAKQDEKYCGKHDRDRYRDQEKELEIRYCDIARGCFNLCEEGRSSCATCLEKERSSDNKRYADRKKLYQVIQSVNQSTLSVQICCYCGKDFAPFITKHNKQSQACLTCNDSHAKQEVKRLDRVVNYPQRRAIYSETHYAQYMRSASKRDINFQLSFDEFKSVVCQPCFYCGTFTEGESIGIDRFDNSKGYILENCRPCCDTCNRMKWTFHPEFFIEKCKILADGIATDMFFKTWACYYNSPRPIYAQYKNDAIKRGYEFAITRDEFNIIIEKPCYMCDYVGATGIDRKDNTVGYTNENCRSCCSSCNMSKADIEYTTVIQKAHMVAAIWSDTSSLSLPEVPKTKKSPKSERKRWKAAGLYTSLKDAQYAEILDTLGGVENIEELQGLHNKIKNIAYDEGIQILKTYLNTLNVRRSRMKKTAATTDTITHA